MRQNFAKIKNAYTKLGKGNIRLTQSNLFLVRPILATTTTYTFPVLESEVVGLLPDEIRLNQNDEFIITHVGIYLKGQSSVDGAPAGSGGSYLLAYTPLEISNAMNPVADFHSGFMRISVNNVNFVDKWGIRKHNNRPRTPSNTQGAVALNGSAQPNTDFSQDGVYDCSPMVTLSGAKKNEVTIVLPKAITAVAGQPIKANDGTIYRISVDQICINLFGYLGQNGAKFQ